MKTMKKIMSFAIIIILIISLGCTNKKGIQVESTSTIIRVDNEVSLSKYYDMQLVYYKSSNDDIFVVNDYIGKGISEGDIVLSVYSKITNNLLKEYLIEVRTNTLEKITLSGSKTLVKGKSLVLEIETVPEKYEDEILWTSSDDEIATVKSGVVTGVSEGFVTIKAISKNSSLVQDEIRIYVTNDDSSDSKVIENNYETRTDLDISNLKKSLLPIIERQQKSILGVKGYYKSYGREYVGYDASAIIYKREYILNDGSSVSENPGEEFIHYRYIAVTNKHIVKNTNRVVVYRNEKEYEAQVIAYDSKVNIAVISFESSDYYPMATFGDSDNVKTGEFIISIGASDNTNIYNCGSLGIISYNQRYLADDTDGDGTSDWDALYLQHDAAISDSACGGAVVNMKGEIIAMNALRINSTKIDNMSFAIPSNTVVKLISFLEQGIVPNRYKMGISFTEVKTILSDETLSKTLIVPEGITNGMYVRSVSKGELGDKTGFKQGDILLEFDGYMLDFSYQIRKALDDASFSGAKTSSVKVYRDGEVITLKVVY